MPRAVWSGTLSFGLVTLPVRLFPATEPKDVRFHLYDATGRRVRYRRVVEDAAPERELNHGPLEPEGHADREEIPASGDPTDGAYVEPTRLDAGTDAARAGGPTREVAWEELARGIEDPNGDLVLLSREEFESVRPERSRSIEVEDFVDLADIDPVYFEKSYHVVPSSPDALRPYALLRAAMERSGRVGIGRFVLRTKPHLVAIRPMRGVLALETLFFGDEVRDAASLIPGLEGVEITERELDLAERLIETLERPWDPAAYADTYREDLLRLLAEKSPTLAPTPPTEGSTAAPGSAVEDLMRALRESVEAAKARTTEPRRGKRRSRRAG